MSTDILIGKFSQALRCFILEKFKGNNLKEKFDAVHQKTGVSPSTLEKWVGKGLRMPETDQIKILLSLSEAKENNNEYAKILSDALLEDLFLKLEKSGSDKATNKYSFKNYIILEEIPQDIREKWNKKYSDLILPNDINSDEKSFKNLFYSYRELPNASFLGLIDSYHKLLNKTKTITPRAATILFGDASVFLWRKWLEEINNGNFSLIPYKTTIEQISKSKLLGFEDDDNFKNDFKRFALAPTSERTKFASMEDIQEKFAKQLAINNDKSQLDEILRNLLKESMSFSNIDKSFLRKEIFRCKLQKMNDLLAGKRSIYEYLSESPQKALSLASLFSQSSNSKERRDITTLKDNLFANFLGVAKYHNSNEIIKMFLDKRLSPANSIVMTRKLLAKDTKQSFYEYLNIEKNIYEKIENGNSASVYAINLISLVKKYWSKLMPDNANYDVIDMVEAVRSQKNMLGIKLDDEIKTIIKEAERVRTAKNTHRGSSLTFITDEKRKR